MNPSSSPMLISMSPVIHHDVEYYINPLIFQVENALFRVPHEYLVQELPVFLDMLVPPQPVADDEDIDGKGAVGTKPLTLPSTITASSFRALLRVLYPFNRPANSEAGLSKDDWIALLELSRSWDMTRIRKMAIEHLVPLLDDDPAHKWNLAKKYGIHDWVRPALERLIRRSSPLGNREFEMLDQETLLKLGAARESCYPVLRDSDPNRYGYFNGDGETIGRWDIRQQRGQIDVDLGSITFTCSTPPMHSADQAPAPAAGGLKRNGEFYVEKVVFQVEDNLYKVSNQPFSQHSSFFRRRFESRGFVKFDRYNPLIIDADVTKADFECLLRFFFPPKLSGEWEPSPTEWALILRLSAKWEMDEVKSLAAQKLGGLNLNHNFGDIITKLRMAQELGVQAWFASGMKALVTRQEPLSNRECQILKSQYILQVLDLRERAHHRTRYNSDGSGCTSIGSVTHILPEHGEIPDSGYDLTAKLTDLL